MHYSRARKHYRAAQKNAAAQSCHSGECCSEGVYIPKHKKNKLMITSLVFIVCAFAEGFTWGYLFAKSR